MTMAEDASHCENCGAPVNEFVASNTSEMFMAKQMLLMKQMMTANSTGEEGMEKIGPTHRVTA